MTDPATLLSPLDAGVLQLKHRIGLSSSVTNLSEGPGLSREHLAYFEARIKGGIAMLSNDPLVVHPSSQSLRTQLGLPDDCENYQRLIQRCKESALPAIQPLLHVGANSCAATAFYPAWSPSGIPSARDQDGSHAMSEREIETLLEAYTEAAVQAQALGFDGIEILAGSDMLPEQFWNPRSNMRQDQWGGDLANRMRFTAVLVDRIRRATGCDFIIGCVMSGQSNYRSGLSDRELQTVLAWLVEHTDITYYSFDCQPALQTKTEHAQQPSAWQHQLTHLQRCRELTDGKMFVLTGELTDLRQTTELFDQLRPDWIGLNKALLADPALPEKLMRGDEAQIRPCIQCNQQCESRIKRDIFVSCLVNPEVGTEAALKGAINNPDEAQQVLVVGGGLAGLESARCAAEIGHQVELVEQSDCLGGAWLLAAKTPGRQPLGQLLDWYRAELQRLQVNIHLNTRVDEAFITHRSFDHLIIATGSRTELNGFQRRLPNFRQLPGIENGNVFSVTQAMLDAAVLPGTGEPVLILDDIGNWQGLGAALYLSSRGYPVTVLSRHSQPAAELAGHPDYRHFISQAESKGVRWINDALLMNWLGNGAEVYTRRDGTVLYPFTSLVLATTASPNTELEQLAVKHALSYSLAGDCQGARRANMAIYEGRLAALNLASETVQPVAKVGGA